MNKLVIWKTQTTLNQKPHLFMYNVLKELFLNLSSLVLVQQEHFAR